MKTLLSFLLLAGSLAAQTPDMRISLVATPSSSLGGYDVNSQYTFSFFVPASTIFAIDDVSYELDDSGGPLSFTWILQSTGQSVFDRVDLNGSVSGYTPHAYGADYGSSFMVANTQGFLQFGFGAAPGSLSTPDHTAYDSVMAMLYLTPAASRSSPLVMAGSFTTVEDIEGYTPHVVLSGNTGLYSAVPLDPNDSSLLQFYVGGPGSATAAAAFTVNSVSISAVPEPSTVAALAGAAVLGFAAWRRRVRHRAAPRRA